MTKADSRTSFVNQVNSFVGQKTVADVLVRQLRCSYKCFIRVSELVMNLITFAQTLQNLNGFFNSWFRHFHWLKTSLQGRVLLDMLPVLVQRCGSNALQSIDNGNDVIVINRDHILVSHSVIT